MSSPDPQSSKPTPEDPHKSDPFVINNIVEIHNTNSPQAHATSSTASPTSTPFWQRGIIGFVFFVLSIPFITAKAEQILTNRTAPSPEIKAGLGNAVAIAPLFLPSPRPVAISMEATPSQPDLSTPEGVIQEYYKRLNEFLQKDPAQRRASQPEFLQQMSDVRASLPNWDFEDNWWSNRVGVSIKPPVPMVSGGGSYGVCVQWLTVDGATQEEAWVMLFNWAETPGKIVEVDSPKDGNSYRQSRICN